MKTHWNLMLQVYQTGWLIQHLTAAKTRVSHSLHLFSFHQDFPATFHACFDAHQTHSPQELIQLTNVTGN